MRTFWVILFCVRGVVAFGQNEINPPSNGLARNVISNLGTKKIQYSDVNGDYFWRRDWLPARVVMQNGAVYHLAKAKLNFYSNAIHFVNEQGVETATQGGVMEVTFTSPVESSKTTIFKIMNGPAVNFLEIFAEVLVDGKTKLLKATPTKLVKRETDPLLAKTEWRFESNVVYFIEQDGDLRELRGLSKTHVFDILTEKPEDEEWLKAHGNKLKKESDLMLFIAYRNSASK